MEDENYLKEMGFPESLVKRALAAKGHLGLQAAIGWCLEHAEDPEVASTMEGNQTPMASAGVSKDEAAGNGNAAGGSTKEEKSEESGVSKEEKVKQLQDKISQRRAEQEEQIKQDKIEQEKRRRIEGQNLAKLKTDLEYRETQKLVEQRKRDKLEDKLARQRVRDMIAQDREDKKREREHQLKAKSSTTVAATTPTTVKTSVPTSTDARLQIVCPDGSKLIQTFKSQESLSAVRLFVKLNRKDEFDQATPFGLMSAFPKKVFSEEDYDAPLNSLGLAPSAVLHVTRVIQ